MSEIKNFVRAMVKSEVFVSQLTLLYKYSSSVNRAEDSLVQGTQLSHSFWDCFLSVPRQCSEELTTIRLKPV